MSPARRDNPKTLALALGVGVVGLLVAGGVWWYVSQTEEGDVSRALAQGRALAQSRTFDKQRAKTLAAEAAAARGGKRVGVAPSSLRPGNSLIGPRYQPSDVPVSPEETDDTADLAQPFSADGAPV